VLVLIGASFAAGNLWIAAARSTIPFELRERVVQKQRLVEKTPGVDELRLSGRKTSMA
jgi:hypothetical protein